MNHELEIVGKSKRSRFVKIDDDGNLIVNWEIYGDGNGGRDMETTLIVSASEFPGMKNRYGYAEEIPLLEVLWDLSNVGRGDEFIDELFDGTIALKEKHVF
jgi:hypothetical protein